MIAGTYMPGLKALTDRLTGKSRIRATSFYTSSFGVGSAFSFLIGGYIQDWFAWEIAFWFAGICALLAILIICFTLENLPNKNVNSNTDINKIKEFIIYSTKKVFFKIS